MLRNPNAGLRTALAIFALLPVAHAQSAADAALQVSATVTANPPSISFTWPSVPGAPGYNVSRRAPGSLTFGPVTVLSSGTTTWTDTDIVVGERYEYRFLETAGDARGIVTAGIEAAAIEDRGKVVLVVDDTHAAALASRIDRLIADLVGDGWQVARHDVAPTDSVPDVKALIVAEHAADPSNVNTVFLLGNVPVPYSGNIVPDGHSNNHHGAWPADVFYGELDGTWTDTFVNNTSASRPENHNVPEDGKYDQSVVPSPIELRVGRVDLSNMPAFAQTELELLQAYLDKNHDYRHKVFTVEQRAVIDDHFGWFGGEAFAATGWRNFSALVGTSDVIAADYFSTLDTTSGPGYAWSYGCGGGSYTSANGIGNTADFTTSTNRTVFTVLFGSYFGDWDSTNNFLRAPLCSGWTLTNAWAGRPHWQFHPMGLGETVGACAKLSQYDTTAGGIGLRNVHIALMGDPTLRQHVIAPPTNVAIAASGTSAVVSWTGPAETVDGFHVYRSANPSGPFARVNSAAVAGASFTDATPLPAHATYLVRAVRLESVPTGSYWNLSQGAVAHACLPDAPAMHSVYGAGCHGTVLSASPPPVSTPAAGTTVDYVLANMPEDAPGSGSYSGATLFGFNQEVAGIPLDLIGAPGCSLYIGNAEFAIPFSSTTDSVTTQLQVPPNVPCGVTLFANAAVFVAPFSLPGEQNALGLVTSNGVESRVGAY